GKQDCNGSCIDTQSDTVNCGACGNACGSGEVCINGQCYCPGGKSCNGRCTNINNDPLNCGRCGLACPAGYACCNGNCCQSGACADIGFSECCPTERICKDSNDLNFCCSEGQICCNGQCADPCDSRQCEAWNPKTCRCEPTCGSCQICDYGVCRNCD